jgi:hypothetical protein
MRIRKFLRPMKKSRICHSPLCLSILFCVTAVRPIGVVIRGNFFSAALMSEFFVAESPIKLLSPLG